MTEKDGEEMMKARMTALEQIALECFMELCAPLSQEVCKSRLEAAIKQRAGWCHDAEVLTL